MNLTKEQQYIKLQKEYAIKKDEVRHLNKLITELKNK